MLSAGALAACTSSQDVLEPSAITPPPGNVASTAELDAAAAGQPVSGPQTSSVAAQPLPTASAAATGTARLASVGIQFAPIVGPSVEAATTLSNRLALQARERGIRIIGRSGTGTTHMLRGYFTPLIEDKQATVVYVWDVYDLSGNRVHRISGQETAAAGSGDGWAAVPASAMDAIGAATMQQLAAWLSSSG
ncbi:MAG: hypothetical protein KF914_17965 [Rhizobiaceae bacterium]|nr:hypothetical protein [Rhizobiaceae bacterium]